ncbi:MAG TPA: TlpA disulfide reductase family protein [Candidatus Limnocylindria bacterium]|nr:TlpA disulfide reductase family protein [Candidatus Limnocylindria bacterium]
MTTKANRSRGMPRRTATQPRSSRAPLLIGIGVIGLVLVLAIVAMVLGGTGGGGLAEPATTPIQVSGDTLPALDAGAASDPAVGLPIPTITGTDLDGEPMTIGPDDGPMAIVIVAHWCPHCQAEVPLLVDDIAANGLPDGVSVATISTSINRAQPNYPPSAWLERESWNEPTMVDDANSTALAALGMTSFPGFVFVDADGNVVSRTTGEIPIETWRQALNSLAP